MKEENCLRVFKYLEGNYKGLTLELYRLGSTIFIDRRFIQEALQYDDHRQLARMRSNFPEEFDKEYIPEYIVDGTEGTKRGLYTLEGLCNVAGHTRDFRGADELLLFIKAMLVKADHPAQDEIQVEGKVPEQMVIYARERTNKMLKKLLQASEENSAILEELMSIKEHLDIVEKRTVLTDVVCPKCGEILE